MIPGNWREVDILLTKVDILLTNSLHGSLICVPFVRYEVTSLFYKGSRYKRVLVQHCMYPYLRVRCNA